jgi:hypothetical protein
MGGRSGEIADKLQSKTTRWGCCDSNNTLDERTTPPPRRGKLRVTITGRVRDLTERTIEKEHFCLIV